MKDAFAQLTSAFGLAVSMWALGVAIVAPVIVQCFTSPDGWAAFTLSEGQVLALAAVIAGPVALTLRLFGIKPQSLSKPPETPAQPQADP